MALSDTWVDLENGHALAYASWIAPRLVDNPGARDTAHGHPRLGVTGRAGRLLDAGHCRPHRLPGVMDTVALAAAAATTTSIGLLSNIMIGPVWPPVLLAKETAAIDAISGGRLTLGLGVGIRPDDFVVDGLGVAARGQRFDQDLGVYRRVWKGEPVGGWPNPAVTPGAREIPLVFGGTVPATFERVARWGTGYVGLSLPAPMVAPTFEAIRAAWAEAGREGSPYLIAIAYSALGDTEQGQANVWDYYSIAGDEVANLVTEGVVAGPARVKDTVAAFADIGADELILNPTVGDLDEITRLADIVL